MKINLVLILIIAAAGTSLTSCRKQTGTSQAERSANALASYVAPGEKDEYYLFYSGGHSGQVYVAGIPSLRHISTIPVFAPYPGTGYGFDEESKKMLGDFTWGDVHHPALLGSMSQHLRVIVGLLDDLTLKDMETRLANWLLKQCPRPIGTHPLEIKLDRTKRVLAAEMGTTSETLSRTLAKFRDQKFLRVKGNTVVVMKPHELQKLLQRNLGEL
jgi:nitrous-oxide reductase